jgi:hypothetical protein
LTAIIINSRYYFYHKHCCFSGQLIWYHLALLCLHLWFLLLQQMWFVIGVFAQWTVITGWTAALDIFAAFTQMLRTLEGCVFLIPDFLSSLFNVEWICITSIPLASSRHSSRFLFAKMFYLEKWDLLCLTAIATLMLRQCSRVKIDELYWSANSLLAKSWKILILF